MRFLFPSSRIRIISRLPLFEGGKKFESPMKSVLKITRADDTYEGTLSKSSMGDFNCFILNEMVDSKCPGVCINEEIGSIL